MQNKPVINIVTAGDRYNYGDVLYAIVMSEYIKKYEPEIYNNYNILHYGIIKSDLTSVGGIETLPIKQLYNCVFAEKSMTVVAGGQVIGANIEVLFKFLKKNKLTLYADLFRYFLFSKIGKDRGDLLVRRFCCKHKFPYIISAESLSSSCIIAYSNVGGSVASDETQAVENIKRADYFSVRDTLSFKENKKYRDDIILTPDAAVIMSDVFPREKLDIEVSKAVRAVKGRYIAIQFSLSYYRQHTQEIVSTLTDFKKKYKGINIVLVPIGYAILHDDLIALKELKIKIPEAIFIEKLTIKEIMYLISGSELCIATSLHGIVTAMSYSVPYIALGAHNSSTKLDEFVNTWGCEPYNHTMPISKLFDYYDNRLKYDKALKDNAKYQLSLAKQNYDNLFALIK